MEGARHPFDIATDLEPTGDGDWLARTSDAYWNMVGPFGGLIAALMFKSAHERPDREGEPIALTVNFCAAIAKGELRISAKPARTNRSTQHWTMTMLQAGECVATATAMFGKRPDTFAHRPAEPPAAAPFESLQHFPRRMRDGSSVTICASRTDRSAGGEKAKNRHPLDPYCGLQPIHPDRWTPSASPRSRTSSLEGSSMCGNGWCRSEP